MSIIIKLQAGLGNQLFQYAYGRALQIISGKDVYFDDYTYTVDKYRKFLMNNFKLDTRLLKNSPPFKFNPFKKSLMKKYLAKKKYVNVNRPARVFYPELMEIEDETYIEGFFASNKYFDKIKDVILKDFQLKTPLNKKNKNVLRQIKSTMSVSIHVRRSDFLADDSYTVLTQEYYSNGIEYISSKYDNIEIFVFSDDIDWSVENLKFDNIPTHFININNWHQAVFDLELMKNCKHNILANSTFSWWAGYLNENNDKIVIAPSNYYTSQSFATTDFMPEDWIKMQETKILE